jgi:hypothetical protein
MVAGDGNSVERGARSQVIFAFTIVLFVFIPAENLLSAPTVAHAFLLILLVAGGVVLQNSRFSAGMKTMGVAALILILSIHPMRKNF